MTNQSEKKQFSRACEHLAVVCVILALGCTGFFPAACGETGTAIVIGAGESGTQEAAGNPTESGTDLAAAGTPAEAERPKPEGESRAPESDSSEAAHIWVHICGQVREPGVYELEAGSRVWDAVEAAGGFGEDAKPDAVNLAVVLEDGSKVTIPSAEEADQILRQEESGWYEAGEAAWSGTDGRASSGGADGSALVDINRADASLLMSVPGIGQVRADAIVAYREANGAFRAIEDIMNVTGIKEGLFAKIKDYITVGG